MRRRGYMMRLVTVCTFLCLGLWAEGSGSVLAQDDMTSIPIQSELGEQQIAVLRALDKITARTTEFSVPVGDERLFGTLAIKVRYCRTRPPIEPPESFAYLEIDDLERDGRRERVFSGWMVASNPALHALEHPVYDVWVINCMISDGAHDTGNR